MACTVAAPPLRCCATVQAKGEVSDAADPAERQADETAAKVVAGDKVDV